MEFANTTSAGAAFLNTTFGQDRMMGAVIARLCFQVREGRLVPTPDFQWPVGGQPAQTPYGIFPEDVPFLPGGIDFMVIGSLWQPDGLPAAELIAEIRAGERFLRRIAIIGDRGWVRRDGILEPGPAAPFASMPLSYDRAFGGKVELEGGPCAWPANPSGRGFYLTPEQAEGQPLPNLEDPAHRIATIEDRPEPLAMGPYPADGSLRAERAVELDLESDNPGMKRIHPLIFNHAHPSMVIAPADTPRPGDLIEVTHASPQGALRFAMPDLAFHAEVDLQDRHYDFPLHLDQILLLLDEQRVVLGYRVVFRYRLVKYERRRTTLRQTGDVHGRQ